MWTQPYHLLGQSQAISALIAAIPIFVVLLALGLLRTTALRAGLYGLTASILVATIVCRMPVRMVLGAASFATAFALFPINVDRFLGDHPVPPVRGDWPLRPDPAVDRRPHR